MNHVSKIKEYEHVDQKYRQSRQKSNIFSNLIIRFGISKISNFIRILIKNCVRKNSIFCTRTSILKWRYEIMKFKIFKKECIYSYIRYSLDVK